MLPVCCPSGSFDAEVVRLFAVSGVGDIFVLLFLLATGVSLGDNVIDSFVVFCDFGVALREVELRPRIGTVASLASLVDCMMSLRPLFNEFDGKEVAYEQI